MGIPDFYPWLKEQYPSCIRNKVPAAEVVAIDLNGILHSVASRIFLYGDYAPRKSFLLRDAQITRTPDWTSLLPTYKDELVQTIQAIERQFAHPKVLIICMDGVAPSAKLIEQRRRRAQSEVAESGFDPCFITAGTSFMDDISAWIKTSFPHAVVSDHREPGEGEHKCIRLLSLRLEHNKVIYGVDGDLILLGLTSRMSGLYIYRLCSDTFVSIDTLASQIGEQHIESFVVAVTLVGNDFLPRCITMTQLSHIVTNRLFENLVNNSTLQTGVLLRALEAIDRNHQVALLTRIDMTIAHTYVDGLQWVLSYYTKHNTEVDQRWCYMHQIAPLVCALKRSLETRPVIPCLEPRPPLSIEEQLLYITPVRPPSREIA